MTKQDDLTVNLNVRVTPSMLQELRDRAAQEDRTVTWLVRKAITDLLEKH